MKAKWQTKTIGEIMKLEYGKPLSKSDRLSEGGYPAYGANGEKCRSRTYFIDNRSIVIGRKGSAGELTLTSEKFWPLDVTYYITFDDQNYDLKFLYYLLKLQSLPRLAKGVKPGINRNEVYSISVKVPESLLEQKRIVSILDEFFAAVDRAKENTKMNLQNANELFEAYINNVFQNEENKQDLKNICSQVITGPFGSTLHKSDYVLDGIPIVNPQNIENGRIIPLQKTMVNQETAKRLIRFSLQRKDIVIARRGEMGRCAVVENGQNGWLCGTGSFVIRLKKEVADERFVAIFLRSSKAKQDMEKSSTGATMSNLNQNTLLKLQIPVPPFNKQGAIVNQFEELSHQTQNLKSLYTQKLSSLDELKQSLLSKAFNGEL